MSQKSVKVFRYHTFSYYPLLIVQVSSDFFWDVVWTTVWRTDVPDYMLNIRGV